MADSDEEMNNDGGATAVMPDKKGKKKKGKNRKKNKKALPEEAKAPNLPKEAKAPNLPKEAKAPNLPKEVSLENIHKEDAILIVEYCDICDDCIASSAEPADFEDVKELGATSMFAIAMSRRNTSATCAQLAEKAIEFYQKVLDLELVLETGNSVAGVSHKLKAAKPPKASPVARSTPSPLVENPEMAGTNETALLTASSVSSALSTDKNCGVDINSSDSYLLEQLGRLSDMFDARVDVVGYNILLKNADNITKEAGRVAVELKTESDARETEREIILCAETLKRITNAVFSRFRTVYKEEKIETYSDLMYDVGDFPAREAALHAAVNDLGIDKNDFDYIVAFQRDRNMRFHAPTKRPEVLLKMVKDTVVGEYCAQAKDIALRYTEVIKMQA